jgi:hypothetical protein
MFIYFYNKDPDQGGPKHMDPTDKDQDPDSDPQHW